VVIEVAAHQQSFRAHCGRVIPVVLFGEPLLDGLEQAAVEDRRMLRPTDLAPEDHFADVEPVAQEIGERASGEGDAADGPPIREMADLGTMPRARRSARSSPILPSSRYRRKIVRTRSASSSSMKSFFFLSWVT
jgi:hypothetical protein